MRVVQACVALLATCALGSSFAARPLVAWDISVGRVAGITAGGGDDFPRSTVADAAGDVYVTGEDGSCPFVMKRSGVDGGQLWRVGFECPGGGASVALDGAGGLLVASRKYLNAGDIQVTKLAVATGAILWSAILDVGARGEVYGAEIPGDLAVDANGDVFVYGTDYSGATNKNVLVKYEGATGALRWRVDAGEQGLALVRVGTDVVLAGTFLQGANPVWMVARHAGSDGAVLWRALMPLPAPGVPVAAAASADESSVVVVGTVGVGTSADALVVRYDARTGEIAWQRSIATGGRDTANAVALDASGDAFVTGQSSGALATTRYRGSDGAVIWQALEPAAEGTRNIGFKVVLDGIGGVIVGGQNSFVPAPQFGSERGDQRIVRYVAATGARSWAQTRNESGRAREEYVADLAMAGSTAYVVSASTASDTGWPALRIQKVIPGVAPSLNYQGLWWNFPAGSQSGWGLNITQQGETQFVTIFTYDAAGMPTWYVASSVANTFNERFSGALYRTSGPPFNAQPFDPARVTVESVGGLTFSFTGQGLPADMNYSIAGVGNGTRGILPQLFAAPAPTCQDGVPAGAEPNFQDLWWASPPGSEAGWGMNIAHQGDVLFITWFTYDLAGKATWFVGSSLRRQSGNRFTGELYTTRGLPLNVVWVPASVSVSQVGTATLDFSNADNGTFDYTVNGISGRKSITRQRFAQPATICR